VPFLERAYAWISCAAGACAFAAATLWYAHSWERSLDFSPVLPADLTDLEALFRLQRVALLFSYGIPLFCIPALLFGLLARKHPAAKAGLSLTAAALLMYILYLRSQHTWSATKIDIEFRLRRD
jgi:hypothetical protein